MTVFQSYYPASLSNLLMKIQPLKLPLFLHPGAPSTSKPPTVGGGVGYRIGCPVWELSLPALLVLKCSRQIGD